MELSIKQWAEADRPREKLASKGRKTLSDAELIAILIGSGVKSKSAVDVAKSLLNRFSNNLNSLAKASISDLKKEEGIGEARAITIISALELGRRRKLSDKPIKQKIGSSSDAFDIFYSELADLEVEEFYLMVLNRANIVLETIQLSKGGVAGTVVDPKVIFQKALEYKASAIILAHNHPSGNIQPSNADIQITKKIKQAGQLLDIQVLDHIIVGDKGYFSFADDGLM